MRGTPRLPSSDSINADSSPTSYAPAPVCVMMSKSTPSLPKMFLPRKPLAYASATAFSTIFSRYRYSPRR